MKHPKTIFNVLPIIFILLVGFSSPAFSKDKKGYCCVNGKVFTAYQSKCGKNWYPSEQLAEKNCKPQQGQSSSISSKGTQSIITQKVTAYCCENGKIVKTKMSLKALKASKTCSTDRDKVKDFCGYCCNDACNDGYKSI